MLLFVKKIIKKAKITLIFARYTGIIKLEFLKLKSEGGCLAVFKSKKTYIKRYALKNTDKKIKFASNISSEFGNGGKISAVNPTSHTNSHKPQDTSSVRKVTGEVKFADPKIEYQPKYKFTSVDGDGIINPGRVVSGPGFVKPDPIDKPDLTNVKADAHVRPVIDGETKNEPVSTGEAVQTAVMEKSEPIAEVGDGVTAVTAEVSESKGNVKVNVSEPEKKMASQPEIKKISADMPKPKPQNIKKQSRPARMKTVSSSSGNGGVVAVVAAVALTIGLVGAGGYYGYNYIKEKVEFSNLLNSELAVVYGPGDYIFPEVPQDIAANVAASREAAYNQAMANAYVPKRAEVPNLYKYDYVKTCYLTFDDGPNPDVTTSILDTLKEYNVPATFFVVGKNAVAYPDLIRRMDAEGHSIGNHSYSHDYDYMYNGDTEFDREMNRCRTAINDILGKTYPNMLYRFPGGSFEVYKQYYIWNIEAEGYQYVDWNALTGDSEVQEPDADYIMNALKESTNNGTKEDIVVLMHDAGAKKITAETLPQVIEYLKAKNYVFKAVTNSNFVAQ